MDKVIVLSSDEESGGEGQSTSEKYTSQSNGHGTSNTANARVVHALSDSDDGDEGIVKKEVGSSDDDELPNIPNINLRLATSKKIEMVNEKKMKSNRREEQQMRKKLELEEKARKKEAAQKEREQKKKEAAHAKALRQAAAEIERAKKPGECMKWVSAILDPGLLNAEFSGELLTALRAVEIDYKIEECVIPCSATWERRLHSIEVDDCMMVVKKDSVKREPYVLVVWLWNKLIENIHSGNLEATISEMGSLMPGCELTLAIFGLEDYFRYQKTQKQRDVRSEVLGSGPQKRKPKGGSYEAAPVLSRGDVEFSLAQLQVLSNVSHRCINSKMDLANLVCQFSKAIAEAPFKREKSNKDAERLDWYALGDSKDCVAVDKDGNGALQLWLRQLCQFPLASRETSEAIAAVYPSPLSLVQAYEGCSSEEVAQYLLEDIPVRRGPGPLSTTRRVGPQLSKKIHLYFTTFDESCLIAPD